MEEDAVLRRYFEARPEVRFAYVFGSRARGTAHAGSDPDVAVYLDPVPTDPLAVASMSVALARALRSDPDHVDVRELRGADLLFLYHVLRDGRCIFEREHAERIVFEVRSLAAYYDFLPVLDLQGRALRERFRGAGA